MMKRELDSSFCELEEDSESESDADEGWSCPGLIYSIIYGIWAIDCIGG